MEKEVYWSRFADDFEERNEYVTGGECIDAIKQALRACAISGKVLDLGCGNGTYSKVLAESADLLYAADYSDEMVAASKVRLKDFPNIQVEKQNVFCTSYDNAEFDAVVLINLLHIIPEPEKALLECRRILKPGGCLIAVSFVMEGMSFFNKLGMIYRYLKTYGKPPREARHLTVDSTKTMLETAGFSVNEARLLGSASKAVFVYATV